MKRKKWLLVGTVLGFIILLAISLTKGQLVRKGQDVMGFRIFRREVFPLFKPMILPVFY